MTQEQLVPLLRELAEKLGTTVDHLWGVTVAQASANGMFYLCWLLLLTTTVIVLFCFSKKWYKKAKGSEGWKREQVSPYLAYMPFVFLFVIWAIAFPKIVYQLITAFYNPEYWALQNILNLIQ